MDYFGPFSYVLAKSRATEIEPFAVGVEKDSPTYNSILIATAGGPGEIDRRYARQTLRFRRPGLDLESPRAAAYAAG